MEIKLKNTPEQVELIKKLGSNNLVEAHAAMTALAESLAPVVQKVLNQGSTTAEIFEDAPFAEDSYPSIPLDLYYNTDAGFVSTWSQGAAGGVPTSLIDTPVLELIPHTYRLDSAISFMKKHVKAGRLDIVSAGINRMTQEILVKQERNRWAVLLKALAEANALNGRSVTAGTSGAAQHVLRSAGATLVMKDLTNLGVRQARIHSSFANGTPDMGETKGITDLYMSPEVMASIKEFAFEPLRTDGSTTTSNSTNLPASAREELFRAGGVVSFFGMKLHQMQEFGLSKKYNTLFDTFAGSTSYLRIDGTNGTTFAGSSDEIIVGIDLSASPKGCVRPVKTDAGGGQVVLLPDDQFVARSEKTGMYGYVEEGAVVVNARTLAGLLLG